MLNRRHFLAMAGAAAMARPAAAQCAPVDLGIQNIVQQQSNWCWAAAAQQIIFWANGSAPAQCVLVAQANNASANAVCSFPGNANVPGHMQQIQYLIGQHVGAYSNLSGPGSANQVYQTIANNRPIIMLVNPGFSQVGHFVVIRAVGCSGPNLRIRLNDPLNYNGFQTTVSYQQIAPMWQGAIIVG